MKIGFYIDTKILEDSYSLRTLVCEGNPGMGGTEYAILTISHLLSLCNDFNVTLFVTKKIHLNSDNLQLMEVANLEDSIRLSDKQQIEALVFPNVGFANPYSLKDIKHKVKLVLWCHLFCPSKLLNFFAKHNIIDRYVYVGEEEMDIYRDHTEYEKSDYIYNGVFMPQGMLLPEYRARKNVVTYIGNIKPYKGFHVLAKAWKKVLESVPDAQLNVIGSGKLYDRNVKLGKYGVAVEEYENEFMPYLTDGGGNTQISAFSWHYGKRKV